MFYFKYCSIVRLLHCSLFHFFTVDCRLITVDYSLTDAALNMNQQYPKTSLLFRAKSFLLLFLFSFFPFCPPFLPFSDPLFALFFFPDPLSPFCPDPFLPSEPFLPFSPRGAHARTSRGNAGLLALDPNSRGTVHYSCDPNVALLSFDAVNLGIVPGFALLVVWHLMASRCRRGTCRAAQERDVDHRRASPRDLLRGAKLNSHHLCCGRRAWRCNGASQRSTNNFECSPRPEHAGRFAVPLCDPGSQPRCCMDSDRRRVGSQPQGECCRYHHDSE